MEDFDKLKEEKNRVLENEEMTKRIVKVGIKYDGASENIPRRQTKFSSGMDVCAYIKEGGWIDIPPRETVLIKTGMYLDIPKGYEVHIRGRSGMAIRDGILCHYGTIDSDYHDEVGIILHNTTNEEFTIYDKNRIAQMFIQPVYNIEWNFVSDAQFELSKKNTRNGGFGSTGKT